jgi:S-DNA-T family DNA segregation ATPase FtsK/SpoIIIE
MAKRRPKPQPPSAGSLLARILRAEIIGATLVVLAVLLLLSLLSPNQGEVTGALIDSLRVVFGVGVWLAPVLLGLLGAWLALRQVVEQRALSAPRLAGAAALFVVFETVAHLLARPADPQKLALEGQGGGVVGWLFSEGLTVALGLPAAIGTLIAVALLAVLALSGLSLADVGHGIADGWRWLRGASPGPEGVQVNPPLPLGQPRPAWATPLALVGRLWRRLMAWLQPPVPSEPPAEWPPRRADDWPSRRVEPAGRSVTPAQPVGGASPAPVFAPAPRIIGGPGQTWRMPAIADVLEDSSEQDIQGEDLRRRAQIIETTLAGFGVPVQVVEANQGPAVTQFGLRPGVIVRRDRKGEEKRIKVRVSQIQALANDLSLALAASPIRIEAPVPGRDVVGVEVPNVQISLVPLRGVMESDEFRVGRGALKFGLGRDVSGQSVVADLARMPHLLIAGATGSGKSVCVNAIITAMLLTHTPDTLRFLMIDPKRVELTVYNGVPHLIAPVVVDIERAVPVLQWATKEMERRYKLFAKAAARNIESYNEKLAGRGEPVLPYIVILIDELADLMLSAPDDVERYVCRIAQMARATGMHLVIATQRPSVDVVTGLIKANFPARIAFAVTSQVDSRVILDTPGAEQLLGRGDMLFMAPDSSKLQRLQGCWVAERETSNLVRYWKGQRVIGPETEPLEPLTPAGEPAGLREGLAADMGRVGGQPADRGQVFGPPAGQAEGRAVAGAPLEPPWLPGQEMLQQPLWSELAERAGDERDELYDQALAEVRKAGRASVSLLQRKLRIGYSRAARLIEQLEASNVIGPDQGGSRGREVLPDGQKDLS